MSLLTPERLQEYRDNASVWPTDVQPSWVEIGELVGAYDEVCAQAEALAKVAERVHHFFWEEKETFQPHAEQMKQGFAAVETSQDYNREEELVQQLGEALAAYRKGLGREGLA